MANKQRGEYTLKSGEDRFMLRITTNAVCELEDFAGAMSKAGIGRTWDQVLTGIDRGSLKDVRLFFWVALRDHHPDVATDDPASLKRIGTIIDTMPGGVGALAKVITEVLELNAPPKDDEQEEPPKAKRPPDAQAGIGIDSIAMPVPSA